MHPLFYPKQYVASLVDVDPVALCEQGIRGVLLDLDMTLVAWRGSEIEPHMEEWVRNALSAGLKICIVSNTWRKERIEAIAKRVNVPYILRAGKPRRGSLTRGMEKLGTKPAETAVVGDQIFTDVVGGNRIGAYTILCVPMPGREFLGTNAVRSFERLLMRRLAARGHLRLPGSPPIDVPPGIEASGTVGTGAVGTGAVGTGAGSGTSGPVTPLPASPGEPERQ